MNKMIKRRKDDGFTLIELMIVIAVIGILAVVLVPKVGTIKTQARMAGVDTNIRTVQAYVESRITSWNAASPAVSAADIATDITNAFSGTAALDNPLGAGDALLADDSPAAADIDPGMVVVTTTASATAITINAYDSAGTIMNDKTVVINP